MENEQFTTDLKRKPKEKIVKNKRSYDEVENDYDNVDRALENSEESKTLMKMIMMMMVTDTTLITKNKNKQTKNNKKQKKDLATT